MIFYPGILPIHLLHCRCSNTSSIFIEHIFSQCKTIVTLGNVVNSNIQKYASNDQWRYIHYQTLPLIHDLRLLFDRPILIFADESDKNILTQIINECCVGQENINYSVKELAQKWFREEETDASYDIVAELFPVT